MEYTRGRDTQIFCLTWVKRGAAKSNPDCITLDPDDLRNMMDKKQEENADQLDANSKSQCDTIKNSEIDSEDNLTEYNLDDYDDEVGDFSGIAGLVSFANNKDDPYLTKNVETDMDSDDDDESSSMNLKPDDNLLVCARCGPHSSTLEVFVYNHFRKDFYVHHDIPLFETPLCMHWIGFDPGANDDKEGNLIAMGNFNSTIDIWDLDIINSLEPILSISKPIKPGKMKKVKGFSHTDAILDLSWTENVQDRLASASADSIVALWDLELGFATGVFQHHSSKVQCIEWKPRSIDCMCSGSFNGRVIHIDCRSEHKAACWSLEGEIERITWNHLQEHYFVASTDNGSVSLLDCRKPGTCVLTWQAHSMAIPALSISHCDSSSKSILWTASSDGLIKMWDLNTVEKASASLLYERDMKVGMVHCMQFNPNEQCVLACGGQKESVKLWNTSQTPDVAAALDIELDPADCDTLKPLGGGGENDDDVLNYIAGEDFFNTRKSLIILKNNDNRSKTKFTEATNDVDSNPSTKKVKFENNDTNGSIATNSKADSAPTKKERKRRKQTH